MKISPKLSQSRIPLSTLCKSQVPSAQSESGVDCPRPAHMRTLGSSFTQSITQQRGDWDGSAAENQTQRPHAKLLSTSFLWTGSFGDQSPPLLLLALEVPLRDLRAGSHLGRARFSPGT